MGPNRVLSAPDGPHVGPMNLAIRDVSACDATIRPVSSFYIIVCTESSHRIYKQNMSFWQIFSHNSGKTAVTMKHSSKFPAPFKLISNLARHILLHNSLRPGDAYIPHWTGSSLVQVMTCRHQTIPFVCVCGVRYIGFTPFVRPSVPHAVSVLWLVYFEDHINMWHK